MKKLVLTSLVIGLLSASQAYACSYFINDVAVKNDLAANFLTDLGVSVDQVIKTEISDYSWFESISTPMCPEELTYAATFDVAYEKSELIGCSAKAKVTKIEPWVAGKKATYSIELVRAASCE